MHSTSDVPAPAAGGAGARIGTLERVQMCGIVGVARREGTHRVADDRTVARMRDRLTHRGPDGCGLYSEPHLAIGHRLLAIRDPGASQQPFIISCGGRSELVLAYNGELYNAPSLRAALESTGAVFRTQCDTEVVAHALHVWGEAALPRLRGMFALAAYWPARRKLLLARDPLGIKPMLYATIPGADGGEFLFASEPAAILDHPDMGIAPDWGTVSAYLSTIRITLGNRTMFEGIRTLRPGEQLSLDLREPQIKPVLRRWYTPPAASSTSWADIADPEAQIRATIDDSVRAHLIADQPLCALLSGGLDSTILTMLAAARHPHLATWCTGAPCGAGAGAGDDLAYAARAAARLGTRHHEVPIAERDFLERWPAMIHALCVPLGTPNETAIYAVSEALSRSARVVLSGEGADELFGGYEAPQAAAAQYFAHPYTESGDPLPPEQFLMDLLSWMHPRTKSAWLQPDVCAASESDAALRREMHELVHGPGAGMHDLGDFLRVQHAFNLPGLLGRLDSSTMLASVEGRTPFADIAVAELAMSIPAAMHCEPHGACAPHGGVAIAQIAGNVTGKLLLRNAFRTMIPEEIRMRPKVSFPLPFPQWMHGMTSVLEPTGPVRDVFTQPALQLVASDPQRHWQIAWPMINIASWLRIMWG